MSRITRITPIFSENSMKVLCKRYLLPKTNKDACKHCGGFHETPEEMFERAAFGNEDYYNLLASLDFLPNSPTLFNAGTNQGTFSGCFKFDVEDSMIGIMDVARKAALVQKWGGGVGYCMSAIRPYGSLVKTTHGKACGPIAVLKLYHAVSEMITQGGKREGAQMAILDCYHKDIRDFIHCKDDVESLSTFNLSVACTDDFMKNVSIGNSEEGRLFDEIVRSAWKTGDPGLYFIDAAERDNLTPWLGRLTGTNPCGEVPLLDNEPCNLGSINLSHLIRDGKFDFERLKEITRLATRYLDEVLDNNTFPDEAITKAASLTRKLGLGVMGWADTLALLHIPYDNQEAVDLGSEVMKTVQDTAHKESRKLGTEKGFCPAFSGHGSINTWERNASVTCIAPTGTISILAGCSSGIEPHYTLQGSRVMGDGALLEEKLQVKTDFIPKIAHQIPWEWHIKHQAAFQKYTDLAVSKTINMPESVMVEDIRKAFTYAWESRCKGITLYRDKSRSYQVIENRPLETYPTDTIASKSKPRRKLPKDRMSQTHKFDIGDLEGYLHIGMYEDGTPGELFITASKQGSTISGLLDGLAIVTSIALQYGVPMEALASKLIGTRFEPSGLTGDSRIPMTSSLLDYIFRYIKLKFLNNKPLLLEASGMVCPDCQARAILEEGCLKCSKNCGWSKC